MASLVPYEYLLPHSFPYLTLRQDQGTRVPLQVQGNVIVRLTGSAGSNRAPGLADRAYISHVGRAENEISAERTAYPGAYVPTVVRGESHQFRDSCKI